MSAKTKLDVWNIDYIKGEAMEDEKARIKKRNEDANEKNRTLLKWKDGYFKGHYEEAANKEAAYKKALKSLNKSLKASGIKMKEV